MSFNAFPYLDAVVRETLRLHAPVSMTSRIAMKDDVLPLAVPFTDSKGVIHHEIRRVGFHLVFMHIYRGRFM
jgi:Cytochrome P450